MNGHLTNDDDLRTTGHATEMNDEKYSLQIDIESRNSVVHRHMSFLRTPMD
jgi:hypothetical protein